MSTCPSGCACLPSEVCLAECRYGESCAECGTCGVDYVCCCLGTSTCPPKPSPTPTPTPTPSPSPTPYPSPSPTPSPTPYPTPTPTPTPSPSQSPSPTPPVPSYSVDIRLINVDYGAETYGQKCVTVTAKYSGTSVSGCIDADSEFADLGNIRLFYSPDILQIQTSYVYAGPSQVQVTTSDAGSTIYFGVSTITHPNGLWVTYPGKANVYKGPVTIQNAYILFNLSNSPTTVNPTVALGSTALYSIGGGWYWDAWGSATVSPSSATIQPGRAVGFTVSADLTNAPGTNGNPHFMNTQLVLTSPTALNSNGSILQGCSPIDNGPPCGPSIALYVWELPSTNIAFPQSSSNIPSLTGVSSQDVSNIRSYCMSPTFSTGPYPTYYNNWMQQSLPICIVPQTTSDTLNIAPGASITVPPIPLGLSQAYVPGNYTSVQSVLPGEPNNCLQPCSGTPPVVVAPGIDVTTYLLYTVTHGSTYYGSYYVEVKYSVVGQQSGKVYASGDVTQGPYNNSGSFSYEVYKVNFTMPNEPVVLNASAYVTKPAENVIGIPNVFPLKLGSVTAQFVPMQCQPYDGYGSVGTTVMLPKSGPWPITISQYPQCTHPSGVAYVPAGTTTPNVLGDYAACVTYVPVNQWSGFGEIPCGSLTGSPSYNVCNNAAIVTVDVLLPSDLANQIGWKITTSCGATVTGQGSRGPFGVPLNNGPPNPNCSNPTLTFEITNVPQSLSCTAAVNAYDGTSEVKSEPWEPWGTSVTVSMGSSKPCTYFQTYPSLIPLVTFQVTCNAPPPPPGPIVSSCPSGTIAVTNDECVGEYLGQCEGYLSDTMCCCKPPGPVVSSCPSGTNPTDIIQCITAYGGACHAYLANQPGYCCCSIQGYPSPPSPRVPSPSPSTSPSQSPTPTPYPTPSPSLPPYPTPTPPSPTPSPTPSPSPGQAVSSAWFYLLLAALAGTAVGVGVGASKHGESK